MILYLLKLGGVVPERLGRDVPAAFQHALPAVPSVLLGKGSGQVVSLGHLADSGVSWGSDPDDPPDPHAVSRPKGALLC